MTTDINGLRKAVTKQLDLTLAQYNGTAREGDLVIDCNPGPTLNQLFVGTANGALTPVNTGGGNADSANYANYAGNVTISNQPNITSVGTLTSLTVAGDILPDANVTHNLGSPTQRWDSIYLSNNTIYLGDSELSVNSTGNLTVDGVQVAYISNSGNIQVNAVETHDLLVTGSAWILGNLTVSGNTTFIDVTTLQVEDPVIQLGRGPNGAPLTTNDGKDRGVQLHVYDTGAGAEVDKFMGWKNADDEFVFGSNITNLNDVITVNTLGNVRADTFIGDLDGTASAADQAYAVDGANVSGSVANAVYADGAGSAYALDADVDVEIHADAYAWTFDTDGKINLPNDGIIDNEDNNIEFRNVNNINLEANSIVNIYTDDGNHRWQFGDDGEIVLPRGGTVSEDGGLTGSAIKLTPSGGSAPTQSVLIYPTFAEGDHVHITAGGGNTELYLGDDFHYVKLADTGNVEVKADDNAGSSAAWAFDPAGGLTFPDGTTQTTAYIDSDEPPYRGFYAGLNRFYDEEPSINQIVISNATELPTYVNTNADTDNDAFKTNGLGTATIVVMLNLYGSNSSVGLDPATLRTVVELFIDNVLYDGATPVTDAATAKARFYANWSTIFAPVSGDLYEAFGYYTPSSFEGITATGGTGINFRPVLRNGSTTYVPNGTWDSGTGYTVGDVLTVTGDQYGGSTPANDAIITVTSVGGSGEVWEYTVSGQPITNWPTDYISDGGSDQYDSGNYIDTDVASQIPYNGGDVETSGSYWGGSSEYVVVYQASTWAMMAFNTAVTSCNYNGETGFDSNGTKEVQNLIGGSSGVSLGNFVFTGDIMSTTDDDMYIKANDDLFLDALDDDIHIRANDDVRVYVNYNFTDSTYDGQWVFRSGSPAYMEWPDGSSQYTAWTAQQTQTDQFVNGLGNPDGYVPSVDGSGNFVWRAMATGGSGAVQYDNGGYPNGTTAVSITGGRLEADSFSSVADSTSVNILSLLTSDMFIRTITGPIVFTVADVPAAGRTGSFVLQLTNPGTNVTFWSGIKWNNGTPPTLTTTGTDVLGFYTYDGGTTWVGLVLAQNIS